MCKNNVVKKLNMLIFAMKFEFNYEILNRFNILKWKIRICESLKFANRWSMIKHVISREWYECCQSSYRDSFWQIFRIVALFFIMNWFNSQYYFFSSMHYHFRTNIHRKFWCFQILTRNNNHRQCSRHQRKQIET